MALKYYRYQFKAVDQKLIWADLPAPPYYINTPGIYYIAVYIEESQKDLLTSALERHGFDVINVVEESRFEIRQFCGAQVGLISWGGVWTDNNTSPITIDADITSPDAVQSSILLYSVEGNTSKKKQTGRIIALHDGVSAVSIDHEYTYQTTEFTGLSFTAALVGNTFNVNATLSGVGEDLKVILKRFDNIRNMLV